jgi:hypothetical protein
VVVRAGTYSTSTSASTSYRDMTIGDKLPLCPREASTSVSNGRLATGTITIVGFVALTVKDQFVPNLHRDRTTVG